MSLLEDDDDQIALIENQHSIFKNEKKTADHLMHLLEKLERKPSYDYDVSDIKYSGIVYYKPVGRLEWKRKRTNISGDLIRFTKDGINEKEGAQNKIAWWFGHEIEKEDKLSSLGVSSKKRIFIVSPGEFFEIGLDDDKSTETFMGKLRKVMKGKYNSEEREMKINTSEILYPMIKQLEKARLVKYQLMLKALKETLFISDESKKVMEGYLEQRSRRKDWKKYYCVLYDDALYMYLPNTKASKSSEPFDWIENEHITDIKLSTKREATFIVRTLLRRFFLRAKHNIASEEWVNALKSLQENIFGLHDRIKSKIISNNGYAYTSSIDGKLSLNYHVGEKVVSKKIPKGKEALVGRSSTCLLRLLDDKHVSRVHIRIFIEDNVPYLVDLGSSFGTKLNGISVTKAPLAPNDIIQIGDTKIYFEVKNGQNIFVKHLHS